MSIINQMLRDLDARHASANERAGLPAGLRTLPPARSRPLWPWLLLVGGLIAGGTLSWFLLGQVPPPLPAHPMARAPVPATDTPPSAVPPPPAATSPPVPAVEPVAVAPEQPAPLVPKPHPPAPKPEAAPVPTTKPIAAPAPVVKPPAAEPVTMIVPDKAGQAPAAAPAPASPASDARIDKQPKGMPAHELAEAEYRKGLQAASNGDHAAALPALRRALEIEPRHIQARQALLSVLAGNRQWDEVKQVAQGGLALDPARSDWARVLARLQHEQGDSDGALKTLETYAAHAAGDADFQGLFAFLLQKRQRYAEAAQRYQAALALRPAEGRWWYGLGLALEGAGRSDEAKAAYGKARDTGNLPADMLGVIEQKLR